MARIGERRHAIAISDEDIIAAGNLWKEKTPNEDAPEMAEAVRLKTILSEVVGSNLDMLCVLWLRNQFVRLRKSGRMKPTNTSDKKGLF
jgi:hypothetical protein